MKLHVSSVMGALSSSLLVAALALPADAANLRPFEPVPGSITLQKAPEIENPRLGNAVIEVRLDEAEMSRLSKETGRTDFFVLGAEETVAVLRDDGVSPDRRAKDGVFSAFIFADDNELSARAERDQLRIQKNDGKKLIFKNRALSESVDVQPFDFESFSSGLAVTLGPPVPALAGPTPGFANAFQKDVLMITHPGVVTDPGRTIDPCNPTGTFPLPAWSFGRLMTDIANPGLTGINPSIFVEDWLNHWLTNQVINGFTVNQRLAMQNLIDDWRAASGGGLLDLSIAPFRLIAIVPRLDLRETTTGGGGYGGGASGTNFLNAGEGRFIFAVMDPFNVGCQELPWTVILEYGVPLTACNDVKNWAQSWSDLDLMIPGTIAYNTALQNLTDVFAAPGADPSKPNHSAINQIRTNENALNPLWELREFRLLDPTPSLLSQTTVADTPDNSFNNTPVVNSIIGGAGMGPFLGGASEVPTPNFFWDGNPSSPTVGRHQFSLGTCNGCHGGETDTFFVHVNPAPNGTLSFLGLLSDFLIGADTINITPPVPENVEDPVATGTHRFFDDLDRRETDINSVAGMSCSPLVAVDFAHVSFALEFEGVLPPDLHKDNTMRNAGMNISIDLLHSPAAEKVH